MPTFSVKNYTGLKQDGWMSSWLFPELTWEIYPQYGDSRECDSTLSTLMSQQFYKASKMQEPHLPFCSCIQVPGSLPFTSILGALWHWVVVSKHYWMKPFILISAWYYFRSRFRFVEPDADILCMCVGFYLMRKDTKWEIRKLRGSCPFFPSSF